MALQPYPRYMALSHRESGSVRYEMLKESSWSECYGVDQDYRYKTEMSRQEGA